MGARTTPAESGFFICYQNQKTFRQLPNSRFSLNMATKRESVSPRNVLQEIFENFTFRGHLSPKTSKLNRVKQAPDQFSQFCLFFPYKTPKMYYLVTSLHPRGYIAECFPLFHVVVEGPRGCVLLV